MKIIIFENLNEIITNIIVIIIENGLNYYFIILLLIKFQDINFRISFKDYWFFNHIYYFAIFHNILFINLKFDDINFDYQSKNCFYYAYLKIDFF